MKTSIKRGLSALSIALLSACGGGGGDSHTSLSVGNTGQGFVCVQDIGFFGPTSPEAKQVTVDLLTFYGVNNPSADIPVFSSNSFCGDTALPAPTPNLIIDANYYHNVIVPAVR